MSSKAWLLLVALLATGAAGAARGSATTASPADAMRSVAARALSDLDSASWASSDWQSAVLFVGCSAAHEATGDSLYLRALLEWASASQAAAHSDESEAAAARHGAPSTGEGAASESGVPPGRAADALCSAQAYHHLWSATGDFAFLRHAVDSADSLMSDGTLEGRLSWADAVFMAAPAYAMLGVSTGRREYVTAMDVEFWRAVDALYDEADCLFYRDESFSRDGSGRGPRTADGEGIYWARANGWVLAGLARVLEAGGPELPSRSEYERLFVSLSTRVVALQCDDGLWRSNLLAPDDPPGPETSASALFCFGIAWGVRNGLLVGERFERSAADSWMGLLNCVSSDGRLGWVQPPGDGPDKSSLDSNSSFGSGAFLLAGSEVLRLISSPEGGEASPAQALLELFRSEEEASSPRRGEDYPSVGEDGAWCWFGDPRVVRAGDATYAGWVTSDGDIVVGRHDHRTSADEEVVLRRRLDVDDHASPAIYVDDVGRVCVYYSAHNGDSLFCSCSSRPHSIEAWEPPRVMPTNTPGRQGYTYPNPLPAGGELCVFWRGGNWQPSWSSTRDGLNWSGAATLLEGRLRPYAKYASEGGVVHVAYTDGHPQDEEQNAIRYAVFEKGRLHNLDGRRLGEAAAVGEGDLVYDGRLGPAWIWDVAPGPTIVYVVMPFDPLVSFGVGHQYRYARWSGGEWQDNPIVDSGGPILDRAPHEAYYAGGVSIDHSDPSTVYLSRRVSGVFEIERWVTRDEGRTWSSEAITSGSAADNIRPVVARGGSSVMWMNGDYAGYEEYETAIRALWR